MYEVMIFFFDDLTAGVTKEASRSAVSHLLEALGAANVGNLIKRCD